MKSLNFEFTTSASTKNIWSILSDVDNYHRYIKYCRSSKLKGEFKEGSSWYDWSTVVFLPLKINHKIIKITPGEKIIYQIKMPIGNIWQTILISKGKKTKVKLEVVIDFPNRFIEKTLGALVYMRNREMLASTMNNFKDNWLTGFEE